MFITPFNFKPASTKEIDDYIEKAMNTLYIEENDIDWQKGMISMTSWGKFIIENTDKRIDEKVIESLMRDCGI